MVLFIAGHFLLAGLTATLLARRLGLSNWSAAACGLIYSGTSPLVLHSSQLPVLAAGSWLPGTLWAIDRVLESPRPSRIVVAAATPQDDGDDEDEQALAEIEEFVRVAALLLHGDCVLAARHRQQFN